MESLDLYLDELLDVTDDSIAHYGKGHDDNPPGVGSGRYPWGSGERLHQHDWDFMSRYKKLKSLSTINPDTGKKYTESEIAAQMGFYQYDKAGNVIKDEFGNPKGSTAKLRAEYQIANNNVRRDRYDEVAYWDSQIDPNTGKHYTDTQIAKFMNVPSESSIRSYRKSAQGKVNKTTNVANKLEDAVKDLGFVDVGKGSELTLGTSSDGLKTSLEMLKSKGYVVKELRVNQVSDPTQQTIVKVLCPPGTNPDTTLWKDIGNDLTKIKRISDPSDRENDIQNALTARGLGPSPQVKLSRINIVYDEQGGTDRDGLIQLRAVRDKDGNLQPACEDLSLGNAKYAQIRIAVEGNRYIKGMAVYSDKLPDGVDIQVNSNKSINQGVDKALKSLVVNKDGTLATNPFGTNVVPTIVRDKNGDPVKDKSGNEIRSAINFVGANAKDAHVEGRFGDYSKNLPAQFLSKQTLPLIKQQLKLQAQAQDDEFNDIKKINNPVVKRKMLLDFADDCDASAVDLKAAPIGGQKYSVLLPVKNMKDNECYYPSLPNGTTVALVRFPHAGPFEIPICKVNNNNKEANSFMKNAKDAIGINQHTASTLSGADFDGDTCIVIPLTRKNAQGGFDKANNIKGAKDVAKIPYLDGFDPTAEYGVGNPRFSSMQKMGSDGKMHPTYKYFKTEKAKGTEMGKITNLITDMYAKGCTDPNEISRAVRYSMVVIDAKKHELNWQAAKKDYGIAELEKEYQNNANGSKGVSSLISRAGSETTVPARAKWSGEMKGSIDPVTGEKIYRAPTVTTEVRPKVEKVKAPKGYTWTDEDGKVHKNAKFMKNPDGTDVEATWDGQIKQREDGTYYYDRGQGKTKWNRDTVVPRTQKITKMEKARDARELLSDNPSQVELAYAKYANHAKNLGNKARLESLSPTLHQVYSKEAAKKYAKEVKELDEALIVAKKNAPRERQAQFLATSMINAAFKEHPEYEADDRKKVRGQCLNDAREATGAKKNRIRFTQRQWEAINAGAISESKLSELLRNADKESYMSLALPKATKVTAEKQSRIKSLANAGWTQEQIADAVGISQSLVSTILSK